MEAENKYFNLDSDNSKWTRADFKKISPRTQEAMDQCGVLASELLPINYKLSTSETREAQLVKKQILERERNDLISKVKAKRKKIISECWKPEEKCPLSPEKIFKSAGIYGNDVTREFAETLATEFDKIVGKQLRDCIEEVEIKRKMKQMDEHDAKRIERAERMKKVGPDGKKYLEKKAQAEVRRKMASKKQVDRQRLLKRKAKAELLRLKKIEEQKLRIQQQEAREIKQKRKKIEQRQKQIRKQNEMNITNKIEKLKNKSEQKEQLLEDLQRRDEKKRVDKVLKNKERIETVLNNKIQLDQKLATERQQKLDTKQRTAQKKNKKKKNLEQGRNIEKLKQAELRRDELARKIRRDNKKRMKESFEREKMAEDRRNKMELQRSRERKIENEIRRVQKMKKQEGFKRKNRADDHKRTRLLLKMNREEERYECLTGRKREVAQKKRVKMDEMNAKKLQFHKELEAFMKSDKFQNPNTAVRGLKEMSSKFMFNPANLKMKSENKAEGHEE